ncbi:MAG: hypothetical protein ACJ76N_28530 [Thermoanaerobaculia bacterium]
MSGMRFWGRFLCIAALLSLAASVQAQTTSPGMSLDDEYAKMAEKVPGFGGLYLDEQGTTHVYLQDLTRAGEMQGLGDRVVFQQGDYNFGDLFAWKDQVRPQLAQPGAVYLDIDEQRNRLVFGVERDLVDRFTEGLQSFLRGTRVPPEAVIVEAADPVEPMELLTDKIRPVPAGVQIGRPLGGGSFSACTLGTNVVRAGVKGFVTASHCTATRSVVDGAAFSQSTPDGSSQIGVETVDPPFFTGGSCPPGRQCRFSDAAFAAYDSAGLSAGGKIANPLFWGVSAGTLQVSVSQPRLSVTNFLFGTPTLGSLIFKVGRTTGGTLGPVVQTCSDSNVAFSNITMLCQDRVFAGVAPGDSGSPVFCQSGSKAAILAGILWGRTSALSYVYSPWIFVFTELGGPIPNVP